MRHALLLALLVVSCGLVGCAKQWTRPNTTEAELNLDQQECEREALSEFPVVHDPRVTYRPPAPSALDTNCVQQSGFNNCNNSGAPTAPDANDYNRNAAVRACLEGKGYQYRTVAH